MPDNMMREEDLLLYLELARLCKASYAGPINQSIYTFCGVPFDHQRIVHGSFGRGYCRVFWNDATTVVAFRGTRESVDWRVSNLKAFPVALRDCKDAAGVKVHRGFQRTLDYGDKTTELRSLDAIFDHLEEFDLLDREIVITGHSLGGALATIFAVKFRAKWPEFAAQNLRIIVTFGAPAVGPASFQNYFGDLEIKTIRIVNNADGVPFTPPVLFRHVGTEIWLGSDRTRIHTKWWHRIWSVAKSPFAASTDHKMENYISRITTEIAKTRMHNKPAHPTAGNATG